MNIPRRKQWRTLSPGIICEADIGVREYGRLRAKLLVFDNTRSLRLFWKNVLGHGLCRRTRGAVNGLHRWIETIGRDGSVLKRQVDRRASDPRYFCVIGLVRGYLGMEVITHESVHAGMSYAKRVTGRPWMKNEDFDEEQIAYPSGIVAAGITRAIRMAGLID